MSQSGVWRLLVLVAVALPALRTCGAADDPDLPSYFARLRSRGLFSIAEGYALHRLTDEQLRPTVRSVLVLELARTFAEHAVVAVGDEQQQLFDSAAETLTRELNRKPPPERTGALESQRVAIAGLRAEAHCWPARISPEDTATRDAIVAELSQVIDQFTKQEVRVARYTASGQRPENVSPAEVKDWLADIRWWLARLLLWRAELTSGRNQLADLAEAENLARKIPLDEPERGVTARLMLTASQRLRTDYVRAAEMLKSIAADEAAAEDAAGDALVLEQARLALALQRPDDAVQQISKWRTESHRWPGELAWWQLVGVLQLRDLAAGKGSTDLASELHTEGERLVNRVDEQLGGIWSLRCHQLWEAAEGARQFGPELDRLFRTGRAAITAKNWPGAEAAFQTAARLAEERQHPDGMLEAGWGLAALALQQGEWATAAARFQELATDHQTHPRAPSASLMQAYALARQFDQTATPETREVLMAAIERHVSAWPDDETTSEAWLMRARLRELDGEWLSAARDFARVPPGHAKFDQSLVSAARCFLQAATIGEGNQKIAAEAALAEMADPLTALQTIEQGWSLAQAEFAIYAARLWIAVQPPRYARAAALLGLLQKVRPAAALPPADQIRWELLQAEAVPVLIIALAGEGRGAAAEELATRWEAAPAEQQLALLNQLVAMQSSIRPEIRARLTSLLLRIIERVIEVRASQPAADLREWDLSLARAHLAAGQFHKAARRLETLIKAHPKDTELGRLALDLLKDLETPEAEAVRRLVSGRQPAPASPATPPEPDSPEWVSARLDRIEDLFEAGNVNEARRLIRLTEALYRQESSAELQQRMDAVKRRVEGPR